MFTKYSLGVRLFFLFFGLFLVSGCMSWGELMYLVFGKTADARLTKVYESTGRTRQYLTVEYSFTEADGRQRTGMDTVSLDWPVPASSKVTVRYRTGEYGDSRLIGNTKWGVLALFGILFGLVAFFAIRLWLEASNAVSENPGKRGKR